MDCGQYHGGIPFAGGGGVKAGAVYGSSQLLLCEGHAFQICATCLDRKRAVQDIETPVSERRIDCGDSETITEEARTAGHAVFEVLPGKKHMASCGKPALRQCRRQMRQG